MDTHSTTNPDQYLPFIALNRPPLQRFSEGACDCHFHVYADPLDFPFAGNRSYTPSEASLESFRNMASRTGIDRAVLVHPSVYGNDHRSYEAVLAQHQDWMRGVAVVYPDTADTEIARWHKIGTRGTRCNALFVGGSDLDAMKSIADKVRPHRWHLQLLIDISVDPNAVGKIASLGLPVVIDHFGHMDAQHTLGSEGFKSLLAMVREGNVWVKLSGPYRISSERKHYANVKPLVDALVEANENNLVWGSDWPHPSIAAPMADDADLVDAAHSWLGAAVLHKVMVSNPTRLYWAT